MRNDESYKSMWKRIIYYGSPKFNDFQVFNISNDTPSMILHTPHARWHTYNIASYISLLVLALSPLPPPKLAIWVVDVVGDERCPDDHHRRYRG